MADKEYRTVAGSVEFDPEEKDFSNGVLREVPVRPSTLEDVIVRVTVWPEYADVAIKKGDFIIANGTYEENEGRNGRVFHNLKAFRIAVIPAAAKKESTVVRKESGEKPKTF